MNVLVVGGTRYFGVPTVKELVKRGMSVTVATRGRTPDPFGDAVSRIIFDRSDEASVRAAFGGKFFDVIVDKIAYCSNDVIRLLGAVSCGKYILTSSSAVYGDIGAATKEEAFDPMEIPLERRERADQSYADGKRLAERAAAELLPESERVAVRFPVVAGGADYTGRLRFYVEKIASGAPIFADDLDSRVSFVTADDAGGFLAHIVGKDLAGAVNAASEGDVSVGEIIAYAERRLGRRAILSEEGEPAPYNGYPPFATLDTAKARSSGYVFSDIRKAFREAIDVYAGEYI